MVDIQVLDGGSENKKGMELIFGPHQTLLIHCPPHVLHLLWGDFTKPNRSFIQQLNFAGNWIRQNFNILRKYLPLSARQERKETSEKLRKAEHLPQGVDTRWNSHLEEILVLLSWIGHLQIGMFKNFGKQLLSKNKTNSSLQIVFCILKDETFLNTCKILVVLGTTIFKPLLGFFESEGGFYLGDMCSRLLDVEKQIDNVIEDIETSFASVFKAEEFIEYELGDDHWKTQISELLTILKQSFLDRFKCWKTLPFRISALGGANKQLRCDVAKELLLLKAKSHDELHALGFKSWMFELFKPKVLDELKNVARGQDAPTIQQFHKNHLALPEATMLTPKECFPSSSDT